MTPEQFSQAYQVAADEKLTSVFVYTQNIFARGKVATKETMRVSTWLRTVAVPEYVHLIEAQALIFGGAAPQSVSYHEMLIPTQQIAAFHLQPPAEEQPDYDQTEQNRKLEPISALIGLFHMHGHLRLSSQMSGASFLEINRGAFLSFYDLKISSPAIPSMGTMSVYMALIRPMYFYFGLKTH